MAKHRVRGQAGVSGRQQPRSGALDDEERAPCATRHSCFHVRFHVLEGELVRASKNITETKNHFSVRHQLLTEISDRMSGLKPLRGGSSPSPLRRPPADSFCEAFAKDVLSAVTDVCVVMQMQEYLLSKLIFLNKNAMGHSFLPHSYLCVHNILACLFFSITVESNDCHKPNHRNALSKAQVSSPGSHQQQLRVCVCNRARF